MDFTLSPEIEDIRKRKCAFVAEHVLPLEDDAGNYDDHENIRLDALAENFSMSVACDGRPPSSFRRCENAIAPGPACVARQTA